MSRKRSVRGKSNPGIFDNCAITSGKVLARDRLVSVGISQNVNSKKKDSGCEAGDKCLFPHHKVDEQQNKKPNKSYHSHKGRESEDKSAEAVVKLYHDLGCVSQDSDAVVSPRGKQSRRNPMQKSLGTDSKNTIHRVYATPSLGKLRLKNPHQRSLFAMKFEDRSQEETEKQQRCAGKSWNLAKHIYKLEEKDKATFCSPSEE